MTRPATELALETTAWRNAFEGALLGCMVGDALGLPAENLQLERIQRLWKGEWRMRLFFGRGMISDDTEHTLMVAQALLGEPDDAAGFQRLLARKLRWWFVGLPGGVGLATAKACLKLWFGFSPAKSGINSGGSGPAMRSAIIGVFFADNVDRRRCFVSASARLTHTSWQAEVAALAIAEAAALAVAFPERCNWPQLSVILEQLSTENEWQQVLAKMGKALKEKASVAEFVRELKLERGVSGYSLHVVPVALYSWLRHPQDFRSALITALECGGDTDTVGAILGALCGATGGGGSIPRDWLGQMIEWPRSLAFVRRLAQRLALQKSTHQAMGPVSFFWPGLIPRNILFLTVVIFHGLRRLLPPY